MDRRRLRISTHNVNGFDSSRNFLRSRCADEPETIQCIQEHWLRPPFKKVKGVNELRHLHEDFDGYGTSAMKSTMEKKILAGRPYGGTGFLWNKNLSDSLRPRQEYKHDRVSVLEILDSRNTVLIINAYLPYYSSSKVVEQTAAYHETIGYIDHIMSSNPGCYFILLGDFNCNIYNERHPFTPIIRDLLNRRHLTCTFDLMASFDSNVSYTRTNYGAAGSGTLLDYVFVSHELREFSSDIMINNFPDNLSDHLPVTFNIELTVCVTDINRVNYLPMNVNWANVDDDIKQQYANLMEMNLRSIDVPIHSLIHGNNCCDSPDHIFYLEKYFTDIVNAIQIADQCLPRARPGISKDYWSPELTDLKNASYDAFILWCDNGKPSSGPIYDLKRSTSYRFKLAIKKAKKTFDQGRSDNIHNNLITGNTVKFWKSWQSLHGKQKAGTRINGKIDGVDIANEFAANFKKIYDDANSDQAKKLSGEFDCAYSTYFDAHKLDDLTTSYLSWDDMVNVMSKLKPGKASGSFIKAEHILAGCPQLRIHLHLLFNSMIQHGYVPSDFLKGVISPILKDSEGDVSSLENYRGITLSHVFSYLFEHAILLKTIRYLYSDDLQFGYKKSHSTSHAIYTVKRCIDYFCDHGAHVYASFLDCTKGFDRVSHKGLFLKLIRRNLPLCWIRVLLYWYSNLFSICKWYDAFSIPFSVISGVRQGGVLSAKFWAVYMNDLILILREKKIGCHIIDLFIACVLYADDVCLMAPTRKAMQSLLDTCTEYASAWCIQYNEKKTKVMYFGKQFKSFTCDPLLLNGKPLQFVSEWKYLGVLLLTENGFYCSASKPRTSFFRSSNSILNVLKKPSVRVLMRLLYSICVPNITYACDVVNYYHNDKESLHIALNDAIRRIYSYNRWESIRTLRQSMGYLSVTEIFAQRKLSLEQNLTRIGNSFLSSLSKVN